MRELYPEIQPFRSLRLAVDDVHTLHVEECGRHDGLPVLFLHGGPGIGTEPLHRRFFDPAAYRIILFDQRGCGRSTPHAELTNNNTHALVADIERLRRELGIERWLVFGGSWGSTLGLLYAQAHPERVLGLILRGIYLCRPRDIQWFYQSGADRLLPEAWEEFLAPIPEAERGDLVRAYYERLTGDNDIERMRAAKAWALWEAKAATLRPEPAVVAHFDDPYRALSTARIECHYFAHDCFLEVDQILRDTGRLAEIPGIIVHGRYDLICPVEQAWALSRAWPQAELGIAPDAGHAATEPGIRDALLEATDRFAERLG
ncbi:MAG: prolyl aminopeptidase [Gammaproteobacteria bacterium]|nr:prolyl aminopeptidase [Gammaproteobacteria bacterium]